MSNVKPLLGLNMRPSKVAAKLKRANWFYPWEQLL